MRYTKRYKGCNIHVCVCVCVCVCLYVEKFDSHLKQIIRKNFLNYVRFA